MANINARQQILYTTNRLRLEEAELDRKTSATGEKERQATVLAMKHGDRTYMAIELLS